MTLILGIAVSALALTVIALVIRRVLRGEDDADSLWTTQGRRLPPRGPSRRKRGW